MVMAPRIRINMANSPKQWIDQIQIFLTVSVFFAIAAPVIAAEDRNDASKFGIGINNLGGQIDYRFSPALRVEIRMLTGQANSDAGKVTSQVLGLRLYRIFRITGLYRPFIGTEADYVRSTVSNGLDMVSGPDLGVFGGIERHVWKSLWIGADAGPYVFSLNDAGTETSQVSVQFVVNAYIMMYLF